MTLESILQAIAENLESVCGQSDDAQMVQLKSILQTCANAASSVDLEDATDDLMDFCHSLPCLKAALQAGGATKINPHSIFKPSEGKKFVNKLIVALEEDRKEKPRKKAKEKK